MTLSTTLNKIRACGPCGMDPREDPLTGFCKLRKFLGPDYGDDAPIPFAKIVESNGLDDALWCCRSGAYDRAWRLLGVWFARQLQDKITDERSLRALDVAQAFAVGQATQEELSKAAAAARAAARAARAAEARAAWAAARAAEAARAAATEGAEAAGVAAAWAAAWKDQKVERAKQQAMFLRVVNCSTEDEAVALLLAEMPKSPLLKEGV